MIKSMSAPDHWFLLGAGTLARAGGLYPPTVLRYHSVDDTGSRFSISVERFRKQMTLLKAHGFSVLPLVELLDQPRASHRMKCVALTFDDGYHSLLTEAMPLLQAYGWPATVYVAPGLLGGPPPGVNGSRLMTRDEVREAARFAGVEIGAHTVTHPRLDCLGEDETRKEAVGSRSLLEELIGAPVRTFCYPFGAYTAEVVRVVREAGFDSACTTLEGSALRLGSRWEVCRLNAGAYTASGEFVCALTAATDWRLGLRALARRNLKRQ